MRHRVLQQGGLLMLPMLVLQNWPSGSLNNKINLRVDQLAAVSIMLNTCYHLKPFYWIWCISCILLVLRRNPEICHPLTWFRCCLTNLLNLLKSLYKKQFYVGGTQESIVNYLKYFWLLHYKDTLLSLVVWDVCENDYMRYASHSSCFYQACCPTTKHKYVQILLYSYYWWAKKIQWKLLEFAK